jgi:hypothetical protein
VFDVSILFPIRVGAYRSASRAIDHNLYIRRNHVFEANYRSGLRLLRIGDLSRAEMVEVGFFDTYPNSDQPRFSGAWSVYPFFESGVTVVSDVNRGLFVLRPDLRAISECEDGIDNDADGVTDQDDPHCRHPLSNRESTECGDGYDNDGDGLVDLGDPHCETADDFTEACGIGFELALVLPALQMLRRKRSRAGSR